MKELREAAERVRAAWKSVGYSSNHDGYMHSNQYPADVERLAQTYLAENAADDSEPIDRDWLLSLGFLQDGEGDGMGKKIWEKGVTESNFGDPGIQLLWEDGSLWLEVYAGDGVTLHLHELPNECTRLQVRLLLRALGQ